MRVLKFIVNGQTLNKDPTCDFKHIVAGSSGYLIAAFKFTGEWQGLRKIAAFYCFGEEYAAILENNRCVIPAEALRWKNFEVKVVGVKKDYRIDTERISVKQEVS